MHIKKSGAIITGLLAAGMVHATLSPATSGPSVGHRPVLSAKKVNISGNAIEDKGTILGVGDKITLAEPAGSDKDGDAIKKGAKCVWYKAPVDGKPPVLVKDPGETDRSCEYTIQSSDIGFKIKNSIQIFSDEDVATASGVTVNPVESLTVNIESANSVNSYISTSVLGLGRFLGPPSMTNFAYNNRTGLLKNIFIGARFVPLYGPYLTLSNYQSHTDGVFINSDGWAEIAKVPAGTITITGRDANGFIIRFTSIKPQKLFEFIGVRNTVISLQNAKASCVAKGMRLASLDDLVRSDYSEPVNGRFFEEWHLTTDNYILTNRYFRIDYPVDPDRVIYPDTSTPPRWAAGIIHYGSSETDVGAICVKNL